MADQPEQPEQAKPATVKRPRPKQMNLWDSFMLIIRPDKRP
jgi:hypothetical protein